MGYQYKRLRGTSNNVHGPRSSLTCFDVCFCVILLSKKREVEGRGTTW
jgi:hypothetical protein